MDENERHPTNDAAVPLLAAAADFAGLALKEYADAYPDQAKLLASSGGEFAVRVTGLTSLTPRVVLVKVLHSADVQGTVCSQEVEIVHCDLMRTRPPMALH